jgi:DNA-binding CsgD family transcriptional regulator
LNKEVPVKNPVRINGSLSVARDLSYRDIAQELVIAQATVEVHVKHVLSKLGYRSRSRIAVGSPI